MPTSKSNERTNGRRNHYYPIVYHLLDVVSGRTCSPTLVRCKKVSRFSCLGFGGDEKEDEDGGGGRGKGGQSYAFAVE